METTQQVETVKAAIAAGRAIWLCTYFGRYGVREIEAAGDGIRVKLGRQRNWTWLAYGQIDQLIRQSEVN